jgi:quercetin dioxygenase-like cupin family protein
MPGYHARNDRPILSKRNIMQTRFRATAALPYILMAIYAQAAQPASAQPASAVKLVTLDPGHFHAALVQKSMYPGVDTIVQVYAPDGPDIQMHLDRIKAYNAREKDPTHWVEHVYTGKDFFDKMLADKTGNTVVLSGNNLKKADYILRSLQSGFNVLADKPMAIDSKGFALLGQAFPIAAKNNLELYDIMTERFEITTILQKELSMQPEVFGKLESGSAEDPAVVKESVHHFYKQVSGKTLTRPPWFFDTRQQGEGMVDVMTHLIDLVQWECFPDQALDYKKDILVDAANHWPTTLTLAQYEEITGEIIPSIDSLDGPLGSGSVGFSFLCNGEIHYRLRGIYVRTRAEWTYKDPATADDTYYSLLRGTKANLVIRQGSAERFKPTLYIEPSSASPTAASSTRTAASSTAAAASSSAIVVSAAYAKDLTAAIASLQTKHPGIGLEKTLNGWRVAIPEIYKEGHEAHFARVMQNYLGYLKDHNMPSWEVPNMLAKYYTTTKALEIAGQTATPASDTLTARVYHFDSLETKKDSSRDRKQILDGRTPDLRSLEIHVSTLDPGKAPHPPHSHKDMEELVIVKEGRLRATIDGKTTILGPGSVAMALPGDEHGFENATGSRDPDTSREPHPARTSYYVLKFQSSTMMDPGRGRHAGGSFAVIWDTLTVQPTGKGEKRQVFDRPTALFAKFEMHATTLNAGEISHLPHVHRVEEIILIRKGNVEMQIGDKFYRAGAGDLVYLSSGVPHALKNTGTGPCQYFALQWQ